MYMTDSVSSTSFIPAQAPVKQAAGEGGLSENEYLAQLRQKYKDFQITVTDTSNEAKMTETLLSRPGTFQVFLDPELLKKMAADVTFREKYEGILEQLYAQQKNVIRDAAREGKTVYSFGAVLDQEGNAALYAAVAEKKETAAPLPSFSQSSQASQYDKKTSSSPIIIRYKYNPGNHLTRLSQARSISNVRGVIQTQYNEMGRARRNIKNKAEAAVTLRRIRNVISKGNIKIARLHKEEALARRCRIAEHKSQAEREQRLRQELREKRMARKAQEHCDTLDFSNLMDEKAKSDYRYSEYLKEAALESAQIPDTSMAAGSVNVQTPEITIEVEAAVSLNVTI